MPWRGANQSHCKLCGGERRPGEKLTARGNHIECAVKAKADNDVQLNQHAGPYFDHWRRRMLASFGVVEHDATDT